MNNSDYKEETKKSYDTYTSDFTDKFSDHFDLYEVDKTLDDFLKLIPGKKILDLGCGPGFHAKYMQDKGFEVTGLDISEKMIKTANKNGIHAILGDIEHLQFDANSFDGIIAYNSLLHLQKNSMPEVIKKLAEILKTNGVLFVSLKQGNSEGWKEDERYPGTKRWFSYYNKDEVVKLFSSRFTLVNFITHETVTDVEHPFFGFTFKKND